MLVDLVVHCFLLLVVLSRQKGVYEVWIVTTKDSHLLCHLVGWICYLYLEVEEDLL